MKIDFEKYADDLQAFAKKLVNNHHDAEDLVQDTVLMAIRKQDLFDGRYPKAWLFKIMYNLMVSKYHRKRRAKMATFDAEVMEQIFGEDPEYGAEEISPKILKSLNRLKDSYRKVLELRANDYSYREIAEIINKPIGTVMSSLKRAREKMQDELRTAV